MVQNLYVVYVWKHSNFNVFLIDIWKIIVNLNDFYVHFVVKDLTIHSILSAIHEHIQVLLFHLHKYLLIFLLFGKKVFVHSNVINVKKALHNVVVLNLINEKFMD